MLWYQIYTSVSSMKITQKAALHAQLLTFSNLMRHFLKTVRKQTAAKGKCKEGKEAWQQGGIGSSQNLQVRAALPQTFNLIF